MENNYVVYMHIFPNNKKYIGITKLSLNERWGNKGNGYKNQRVIWRAIQKYGWDNIKHIIIKKGLSRKDACHMEMELIRQYNTNCYRGGNGYNATNGGDGMLGISGSLHYRSKVVLCDDVEYDSVAEFAKKNNVKRQTVETWLTGKKAMPIEWYNKGLRLKHQEASIKCQATPHSNAVYLDNIEFESQSELAKYLKVSSAAICKWFEKGFPKEYQGRIKRKL